MDIIVLKKIMKEKGITQKELSKISGVPLQTIRYIFSGRTPSPRIDTVRAIEKALEINESLWTEEDFANGVFKTIKTTLNSDEKYLIDLFKQLNKSEQELVTNMIETILNKKMTKK